MLILASASPRRHELLLAAGISHRVLPAYIPEICRPGEPAEDFVLRLAIEKAMATPLKGSDLILAADTTVTVDGEIFGKPVDEEDAARMLQVLSGRRHLVHTGVCIRSQNEVITDLATTEVEFLGLSPAEVEEYTRSGEGADKAGAYAIQGMASRFVQSIRGNYHNVVGLPVALVYSHLKSLNYLL